MHVDVAVATAARTKGQVCLALSSTKVRDEGSTRTKYLNERNEPEESKPRTLKSSRKIDMTEA
jgi:hypothetical protein